MARRAPLALTLLALALSAHTQGALSSDETQVASSFKPGDLTLSVEAQSASVSYPTTHTKTVKLSPSSALKVSMSLTGDFVPQQLMIQVESADTERAVYFAGKSIKSGKVTFEVSPEAISKIIGSQGGQFSATLLIGDVAIASPIAWTFATLDVSHQADTTIATEPFIVARSSPRPEINHVFNQPEKRPLSLISLSFAAAVAAPTALFALLSVSSLGLQLHSISTKGMAFHGSIAAILLLLTLFWTSLNLLQTLPILAVLGGVTLFTGHSCLQDIAARRMKSA
mmetsp:Transcript_10683/g.19347  ORF Transcript_10683/g.19347 Transcript_10683/m.19347 type:complete len:283 (-) Transcript_10683:72-920(-)